MRIWDISPGYLNRQSLLGEHRELHAIVSILKNDKKGYSKHPETLRWKNHTNALYIRHLQLSCEMTLRGYNEHSLVEMDENLDFSFPDTYINTPVEQFEILRKKYSEKSQGRITLPKNIQSFWANHKYSILSRNQKLYGEIGRSIIRSGPLSEYTELIKEITFLLNTRPNKGGIRNSLHHMWGYINKPYLKENKKPPVQPDDLKKMLEIIQMSTVKYKISYLLSSTALSELMLWID